MMKNGKGGMIRVLFGTKGEKYTWSGRRGHINKEILYIKDHELTSDFRVYVFGVDNYSQLIDLGLDCVLLDKKPLVLPPRKALLHKVLALEAAFDDFDDVVLLDWDCIPIVKLPNNFWDILRSKDVIQAPLCKARGGVHLWRQHRYANKLTMGGCFVYMRDKSVASTVLDWALNNYPYDIGQKWLEETYYCRYVEELMGGWESTGERWDYKMDEYLKRFEPLLCQVNHCAYYHTIDEIRKKSGVMPCFEHVF